MLRKLFETIKSIDHKTQWIAVVVCILLTASLLAKWTYRAMRV